MRRIFSAPAPVLALVALVASQLLSLQGQGLAYSQTRELATKGVMLDRDAAVVNDGVVLNIELD